MKLMVSATGGLLFKTVEVANAQLKEGDGSKSEKSEFVARPEVYAIQPVFTRLRMGDIKPAGWIKEQMHRDLKVGFAGRLNDLCHEASTDIFATRRNSPKHLADVTRAGDLPADASSEFAWWNGETKGNWRAGFVMLAYLSGDEDYMRKADAWVQHVLSFQDRDGYLGIYSPELRYKHDGEWWTQACLLRGLLAYAELTGSSAVLNAIRRAIDNTIKVYGEGNATPPWLLDPQKASTQSHDLMLSDVLERLFELTGDVRYRDFTVWIYDNWSKIDNHISQPADANLPNLLDRRRPLIGHGANTLENMRLPLWLWLATGRADLGQASGDGLDKLDEYSLPGGSIVSSEHILNQSPDPDRAEFEYCTTKEAQVTYESAFQKTGLAEYAERVELIFFNDAQGSRLPDGSAITYLTADNRMRLNGKTPDGLTLERRNKFSPTHADIAVCCNPNATQIAAHFVNDMWMRHRDGGLAAVFHGPCVVLARIGNIRVEIEEKTSYPFDKTVEMIIRPEEAKSFSMYFRDPKWSHATKVECGGAHIEREGDFWNISKQWQRGDRILLNFVTEVEQVNAVNGDVALRYGPLLYARPIPHKSTVVKTYSVSGFEDTFYEPLHEPPEKLAFASSSRWQSFCFEPVANSQVATTLRPFDEAIIGLQAK
jgi:DUF1680 family protein